MTTRTHEYKRIKKLLGLLEVEGKITTDQQRFTKDLKRSCATKAFTYIRLAASVIEL